LKRIFKFKWQEVKRIGLVQDGDKLCAFVNRVVNLSFPQKGVVGMCVICAMYV